MLSHDEYNQLPFLHNGKEAQKPENINTCFDIAEKYGFAQPCRNCGESVQLVINRLKKMTAEYESYFNSIIKDTNEYITQNTQTPAPRRDHIKRPTCCN